MKLIALIFALPVFLSTSKAQVPPADLLSGTNIPVGFLGNNGQVRDLNSKPVDFVYYHANLGGHQVFITRYGLSILFSRVKKVQWITEDPARNGHSSSHPKTPLDSFPQYTYDLERIDIVLRDGKINPANITTHAKAGSPQFNMYFAADPVNAKSLQLQDEIVVKNVYPGIDWKLYIKEEKGKAPLLKYDFIVHPHADPSQIRLQYSDNARPRLVGNTILTETRMGTLKEDTPYSYLAEDNSTVPVSYALQSNTLRFRPERYDREKTLVIDPSIFWMTYLSATSQVWSYQSILSSDIETDAAGNIFVQLSAGGNAPFPTVNPGGGAFYQDHTASPEGSMIIIKFSGGGQMLWSTYFGNGVRGTAMTIDKYNNLIAIGREWEGMPSHPNPNPTIPLLNNGGYYQPVRKNYFITKFSNTGVLLWSSYYVNFSSYPMDLTYDVNGNVYVVGWSGSPDFPVVDPGGGAYMVTNPQYGASQVLFISQFDEANRLTWSTRIEGNDYDPSARVCTDKQGNIYIGGQTRSTNYPMVNAGGYYNPSAWGAVLTRFNPARQMTWSTYYPAAFTLADITTDDSSNLYVVADRRIIKFDKNTNLVFEKSVNTTRMHFWKKVNYDPISGQVQALGIMNDFYMGFPTQNTACNGSFFHNGLPPRTFNNATGPIFASVDQNGNFSYLSLTDWPYEYYEYSEMAVDKNGDLLYLFSEQQNGYSVPNPQLTDPGNGAYFDNRCCYMSNGNRSALLLKLRSSELTVNLNVNPANGCSCDGSATVTPLCGQAPFSYTWSNGATTATATGLCPGNHWVRVTDANYLSRILYFTIAYPPGSVTGLNSAVIPENCTKSNGSIKINGVQGGTAPFFYSIDGGPTTTNTLFTGLDSGRHIIKVTDNNGCQFTDTLLVGRIPGPYQVFSTVSPSSCVSNDGSIRVDSVHGGVSPYTFTLNNQPAASGLFTALAPGNYALAVLDTAGCRKDVQVVVQTSPPATSLTYTKADDHCNSAIGSILVTSVTGGTMPYTYSINGSAYSGTTMFGNLGAGNYSIAVKDSKGCVYNHPASIQLADISGPTAVSVQVNQALCNNNTGSLQVTGVLGGVSPYVYSVDNGASTSSVNISGIPPGMHSLRVKDSYGCLLDHPFSINRIPAAGFTISPSDTTVCYGTEALFTIQSGTGSLVTTTWNTPATGFVSRFIATESQKVIVTATDINHCTITDTAFLLIKACNPPDKCLAIPNAFTPNNDGINDLFTIKAMGCLATQVSIRFYNRYGEIVFQTSELPARWDGYYKGQAASPGSYTYVCQYTGDDNRVRIKKGSFILIR